MNIKNIIIATSLLGLLIVFVGAFTKLEGWPYANLLLLISLSLEALAIGLVIWRNMAGKKAA